MASAKPLKSRSAEKPIDDATAAEWVSVGKLKPWVKNPRKNDKAVDRVAASIQRFGFGAPLLARKANGEIIAGHTRLKAALKLGIDKVPVRYLDLSEGDAHLLALADNKLGELAAWDDELLAEVLADAKAEGLDVGDSGFAEHELTKLMGSSAEAEPEGRALDSEPERLRRKWDTALGQMWEIPSLTIGGGAHRLLCGSSTEASDVARLMGDARADMMWTDPPYGVDVIGGSRALTNAERRDAGGKTISNDAVPPDVLQTFLSECFALANRVLKSGAAWYIAYPDQRFRQFVAAIDAAGWTLRQPLTWVKDSLVMGRSDYHSRHEGIYFGYTDGEGRRGRGGAGWYGGDAETTVFEVDRPKVNDLHPTMKPVELVARMVRNSAPQGGLVYEPFSGSGSTMLACEQTGRLCRAIELDPKYVAVALERMSDAGCAPQLLE